MKALVALVDRARAALRRVTTATHVAVGSGDYDAYLAHWRAHHPDRAPPDYATYFRDRQAARYGRGRSRCC